MAKRPIFDDDSVSEYDQMAESIPGDDVMEDILNEYEDEPGEEEEGEQDEEPAVQAPKKAKLAYSIDKRENTIMDAAIVQLEQARLYEMFLKHDLFGKVKANPTARKRVEKELKDFIFERLQILLGMKTEKKLVQQMEVKLPFNKIEIDFLKALSLKGTNGASAQAEPVKAKAQTSMQEFEDEEPEEEEEEGLQSMTDDEELEEEEEELPPPPKKVVKKVAPPPAPVKKKAVPQPLKKATKKPQISNEEVQAHKAKLARQGVRVTDAETRAALEDIKKMANRSGPAHTLTPDQLKEENSRINGSKRVAPTNALPMPSADALVGHYMTQQTIRQAQNPENSMIQSMLAKKLGFSTTGVHQDNDIGDE